MMLHPTPSQHLTNSLSTEFRQKIQNTWPEIGPIWLQNLPSIVFALSQKWRLKNIEPFQDLSYHFVATALQDEKNPVVIKIGCDSEVSLNEYRALKYFDGHGSVQVRDHDAEYSALLLEAVIPGTSLKISPFLPYVSVVKAIAANAKNPADFPHVKIWLDSIGTIKDPRLPSEWIEKALALKDFLLASAEAEYLCHGDLHFDNVLEHHGQFVAIDPKGLIGEMAFEASAFDLLSPKEMEKPQINLKIISDRIYELSGLLNLNPERLLGWVFLRIILSIQWSIEDQGDPSRMIEIGKKVFPLLAPFSEVNFEEFPSTMPLNSRPPLS